MRYKTLHLSNLDFDLVGTLVKCDGTIGLPIYGFCINV